MSTLNEPRRIEVALPPAELKKFEIDYPHLLKLLQSNQVLLAQLSVRVGGPGSGTNVVNLDAITAQADATDGWLAGVGAKAYQRHEQPDTSQYDAMLANIGKIRAETAKIALRIDDIEANRMMLGQILANQKAMKHQIEELEALCLSSLAR